MKMKKLKSMLCVAVAASIMVSTFTACNGNTTGESSGEQMSSGNNGNIEGTVNESTTVASTSAASMNAELNLDLGMFTLFGRPLGDWTYEELDGYIRSNYTEDTEYESESTFNGVKEDARLFFNPIDYSTATMVEERSYIQLNANGVTYAITNTDWSGTLWNLSSFNQDSGDVASSICGQNVESYLESICPGLYAKLQEEQTISLLDGVAMKDSLNNEVERIALCVVGGNLELMYQDGVIFSLTVIFTEQWQATTDVTTAVTGAGLGQNTASGMNFNIGQYNFLGKSLVSWKITELAEYIRNTYELDFSSDGQEAFFIGSKESDDRIWISEMEDGTLSIDIYYANGVNVSVFGAEGRGMTYSIGGDMAQCAVLEGLGAPELAAMFGMTPREYLETVKPGLYDTLIVDESTPLGDDEYSFDYISLYSDGSLSIQLGSTAIMISVNPESGLINYFSFSIY